MMDWLERGCETDRFRGMAGEAQRGEEAAFSPGKRPSPALPSEAGARKKLSYLLNLAAQFPAPAR
jgi:hypothetical protein